MAELTRRSGGGEFEARLSALTSGSGCVASTPAVYFAFTFLGGGFSKQQPLKGDTNRGNDSPKELACGHTTVEAAENEALTREEEKG